MLAHSSLLALVAAAAALPALGAPAHSDPIGHIKRAEADDVVRLFPRQSNYPAANVIPPTSSIPRAWLDRLATLALPNVPVATGTPLPDYAGRSKNDPTICSFTYECRHPDDLYAPPPGSVAFTFDDGPQAGTDSLISTLRAAGAMGKVTHFMIGSFVTFNPANFQTIGREGGHIGVHTWSHQYMTTLTNEQIVAELGWTMQIMSDMNDGRVPLYWRPPYGDVDNRVRAIAKGVFGLETVVWTDDTGDWNLDQGGATTIQSVTDQYYGWLGDKSRGLNVLEHEVRPSQIEVFKNVLPRAQQLGWNVGNVAEVFGRRWYQNAATGNSTVTALAIGAGSSGNSTISASASSASSNSSSSSTTSSASSTSSASVAITSAQSTSTAVPTTPAVTQAAAAASSSRSSGASPLVGMVSTWSGLAIGLGVAILGMGAM